MERITRQVVKYISDMEKKAKQMNFVKNLKQSVEEFKIFKKTLEGFIDLFSKFDLQKFNDLVDWKDMPSINHELFRTINLMSVTSARTPGKDFSGPNLNLSSPPLLLFVSTCTRVI